MSTKNDKDTSGGGSMLIMKQMGPEGTPRLGSDPSSLLKQEVQLPVFGIVTVIFIDPSYLQPYCPPPSLQSLLLRGSEWPRG